MTKDEFKAMVLSDVEEAFSSLDDEPKSQIDWISAYMDVQPVHSCESYSLDAMIAKYARRRLEECAEHLDMAYPSDMTSEEWSDLRSAMIVYLKGVEECRWDFEYEDPEQHKRGEKAFHEYFRHLWW